MPREKIGFCLLQILIVYLFLISISTLTHNLPGADTSVLLGTVDKGKKAMELSLGCGREKEGPDGTEGDKSMPTISLQEMEEAEATWFTRRSPELRVERISLLEAASVPSLVVVTCSMSEGMLRICC